MTETMIETMTELKFNYLVACCIDFRLKGEQYEMIDSDVEKSIFRQFLFFWYETH